MNEINNFDQVFKDNDEREIERFCGIEVFGTAELPGIGGVYKNKCSDFIVQEILEDGTILDIDEDDSAPSFTEDRKDRYTSFNLIKENKDTFDAVRVISNALSIPRFRISYSGLKDKCAITVQKMSIKGDFIHKLKALNLEGITIRNISPSEYIVKLGSNLGNYFKIIIRNIKDFKDLKEKTEKLIEIINTFGFPNYFGLQRFGTFRPNSHLIGKYLLEQDYEGAFHEFVTKTYSSESQPSKIARLAVKESDSESLENVYQVFPKSLKYERLLLKHLLSHPLDYEGAFKKLPEELINLIINAFQSYLFNKMVSRRMQKGYSLYEPLKGDVINILDDEGGFLTKINHIYHAGEGNYDPFLEKAIELGRAVVIAPIIGQDTNIEDFPLMGSFMKEIIKEENLDLSILQNTTFIPADYKGSYRAISVKPLEFKLVDIRNDDLFRNRKKIKIEFSLPKGSYATMLLRELIK